VNQLLVSSVMTVAPIVQAPDATPSGAAIGGRRLQLHRARALEHWGKTAAENLRRIVGDDAEALAALASIVSRHQAPQPAAAAAASSPART